MALRLATKPAAGPSDKTGVAGLSLTFCSYGVTGDRSVWETRRALRVQLPSGAAKPFLTNPTQCTGRSAGDDAGGRHLPAAG